MGMKPSTSVVGDWYQGFDDFEDCGLRYSEEASSYASEAASDLRGVHEKCRAAGIGWTGLTLTRATTLPVAGTLEPARVSCESNRLVDREALILCLTRLRTVVAETG